MNSFQLQFKLIVPLIEIQTEFTYFPVRKPSGINYMFLVLMKEYPHKSQLVKDVLKDFGLAEDVNRIVAEEISIMINNDVITCKKDYSIEGFLTYQLDDFHFTPRGEVVFERQYIQTEREKEKSLLLWFLPFASDEKEITMDAPTIEKLNLENREVWEKAFEKAKLLDFSQLKKSFDGISNAKLGIQSQERVGEIRIKDQLIHLTTISIQIVFSEDGTFDFINTNQTLKSFISIYYNREIFHELIKWNKKINTKVSTDRVLDSLAEIHSIQWGYSTFLKNEKQSIILNSKDEMSADYGTSFAPFFFNDFISFDEILITDEQSIYARGRALIQSYNIMFDLDVNLPIYYSKKLNVSQILEHMKLYLSNIDSFDREIFMKVYGIEKSIHSHASSLEWLKNHLLNHEQSLLRLVEILPSMAQFPNWKNELKNRAQQILDEQLSTLPLSKNLELLNTLSPISQFIEQTPLQFIEKVSPLQKSVPTLLLYEKLCELGFIDKDVLVYINPLASFMGDRLEAKLINPVDKLTIEISKFIERFISLKALLNLETLTDSPKDEGLDFQSYLTQFNQFVGINNFLNGYKNYLPDDTMKMINNFYTIFKESAVYARHLIDRERSNTAFSLLEIEKYVKNPSIEKLRSIVIELSCIVEDLGKSVWKEKPRATLDEMIDFFKIKGWINHEEKVTLHDLRKWRVSLVHPTGERIQRTQEELKAYATLVLSLSQRVNHHE